MTEKRRFLDVWIVESNTVYKEVPYTVVLDWVQQGRLLEDDKLKPSGTRQWFRLGDSSDFTPFLPKPEPDRPEDRAEALEPVELDFTFKKAHEEEDDEVDMIPLIDVSLVLLVFFMLTATVAGAAGFVPTPAAASGEMANNPKALRIDINKAKDPELPPVYSLGVGDRPPAPEDSSLGSAREVMDHLKARLAKIEPSDGPLELVINAHKELPARLARELLVALREEPFRTRIAINYYGVREEEQ